MTAPVVTDLSGLAARYDVFFVDQFGVLHDGERPYDGAVAALKRLKENGATVVLLSNSGRRRQENEARLLRLGFAAGSWDLFLSSGEVAWHMLSSGALGLSATRKRCLLVSRGGDRSAVEGLPCERAETGADADFVLIAGSEGDRLRMTDYERLLRPAAQRGVPALCTNPDRIMLTPKGPCFGAGRIAERYETLGGSVMWIGKPFARIYEAACRQIGNPAPERIVCIGDSLQHDIAGAKAAGLKSALVRSGILAGLCDDELASLYRKEQAVPDYLMSSFIFS